MVKGASYAVITFTGAGHYEYGPSGVPLRVADTGALFQFESAGENWQRGVNASVVVGPLVRAD